MKATKKWTSAPPLIASAIMTSLSLPAHAYVACDVMPTSVMSTDSGNFYIMLSNGGIAYINKSDPDFAQTVALVTTALLTDRSLHIRYADGTACNVLYGVIEGLGISR